jgi:hypothetical protein
VLFFNRCLEPRDVPLAVTGDKEQQTMTLPLKKMRTPAIYIALFLFFYLVYNTVGEKYLLYLFCFGAGFLAFLLIQHKMKVSIFAMPIYALLVTIVLNYIAGLGTFLSTGLAFVLFPLVLPFFPIVVIHYLLNVRQKKIPGIGAVCLMAFGFLSSVIYQTVRHRGVYEYSMDTDVWLGIALVFSCMVYMLLALGTLSISYVVKALAIAMLPEILYIFFLYAKTGTWATLPNTRLGCSVDVPATAISNWLDFTFPMALFIAINEKNKRAKYFFSFLAVLYGVSQLTCATRGSLLGLLLLPPYLAVTVKSRRATIAVLLVTVGAAGLFGRTLLERTFNPTKVDIYSTLARKDLVKTALILLKDNHFVFGIGMDNFRTEKFNYGFMKIIDQGMGMSSHNAIMEFWLGWGLPGIIGWLYLMIGLSIRAVRARLPSEIRPLVPALVLGIAASSIHGLADSQVAAFPFLVYSTSVLACLSFLCSQDTRKTAPQCSNEGISSCSTPQWVPFSNKERLSNG